MCLLSHRIMGGGCAGRECWFLVSRLMMMSSSVTGWAVRQLTRLARGVAVSVGVRIIGVIIIEFRAIALEADHKRWAIILMVIGFAFLRGFVLIG